MLCWTSFNKTIGLFSKQTYHYRECGNKVATDRILIYCLRGKAVELAKARFEVGVNDLLSLHATNGSPRYGAVKNDRGQFTEYLLADGGYEYIQRCSD